MMMSEAFTSFPKYGLSSLSKSCLKKPFLVSVSISLLVHFSKDLWPFLIPGAINWFGQSVLMPTVYFGWFLTHA